MERGANSVGGPVRLPLKKQTPSRYNAVVEFFRRHPMDPARVEPMRGKVRVGIAAVGAAVLLTGTMSACGTSKQDPGFALAEKTTSRPLPDVIGVRPIQGRFDWERAKDRPKAFLLRGAVGGDGYEINGAIPGVDAPIAIDPVVVYLNAPEETKWAADEYGNAYPEEPAAAAALTVEQFRASRVKLKYPEGSICVDVEYVLPGQEPAPAGSFVVHPSEPQEQRVEALESNHACPAGPKSVVDIPVRAIGPAR